MGLKPDHWIRRMALEHGMIEPFVESQKREGVISYGVSSYGYDMRVADEYKIFTNVHSAIVDPKNFTSDSFVDFKGDVCVIPPNSFALARSMEYFRIPRSVLTICVGKSTYARCFRGDTRVALVDGTAPTLEEMARRADDGEMFWGYSLGRYGEVMVTALESPRFIGRDALLEITLDNGERIHCTPDHIFIRRDGRQCTADELRPDDALMPLYRQLARGYEMVYQPCNGHLYPTHRLADRWNLRHAIYEDTTNTHRHHIDFDRQNNNPWNITRMDASEHIQLHNAANYGEDFDPDEHSQSIKDALAWRWHNDEEWRERYSEAQRKRTLAFWNDKAYEEVRAATIAKFHESWTEERRLQRSEQGRIYYADPENREAVSKWSKAAWANASEERREAQREIARKIRIRDEITADVVREALDATGSIRGAARLLNCDRAVFRRFPEVVAAFKGTPNYRNHRVASIRHLAGDHDVYCLTVPEAGNFGLEAGVFVHNCGLIVNVTPFEPEWEGYVTLEISNTTPLPAKVYSNEGISQVLFFEGDEPCDISYADKQGKYQKQTGLTLPKL